MAGVPSLSARGGAVAARTGERRLWWAALTGGLALCLAYAAIPAEHNVFRDVVLYPLIDLGAALAIVAGVRLYRPEAPWAWLLIALCLLCFAAGDLTWGLYEISHRSSDSSLADVFYIAGYPLLIAGLLIAIRRRGISRDRRELIDSAIVGTSAFLVLWVYLVDRSTISGLGWTEVFVLIAYPVADAAVLAVLVWLMLGGRWNVTSLRLLFLGLLLTLAGDVDYAGDVVNETLASMLVLFGVVTIGLAGLHPSMPALTDRSEPDRQPKSGIVRLVLLVGVCAVPVAVLVAQELSGNDLRLPAVVVATMVLAALVVARSIGLTTIAEEAAEREATLSRFAADLLCAQGRDELFAVAGRAASDLAGDGNARIVEPQARERADGGETFTAPVEVRGEVVAELVADGDGRALRRVSDSLGTVAAELSLALERDRLLETERQTAETLARQNEELQELDRMKDVFVSSVSHELRTPLTSMIGYLEILREGEAGELTDEQQHFLEIVDRNCNRLTGLINDILFMSRLDTGRFQLERESLDLSRLVADRVESIQPVAASNGVELHLRADEELPVLGDPARLEQVVDNLLSNAVKFTPSGGDVYVTLSTSGERAQLEVRDTGVGIPEDEAGRLFERFFRASTAKTVQGTGLGLSIVKSIVEAHGGTISVSSEVGEGTTIVVDLPLEGEPA
jgi:signal transduction histidine kinase